MTAKLLEKWEEDQIINTSKSVQRHLTHFLIDKNISDIAVVKSIVDELYNAALEKEKKNGKTS